MTNQLKALLGTVGTSVLLFVLPALTLAVLFSLAVYALYLYILEHREK